MSPEPQPLTRQWHRLHPLSPLVRAGRALVPLIIVVITTSLSGSQRRDLRWHVISDAAVVGVVVVLGVVSWLVTRWRVADGVLQIETGLLRRTSHRYPLAQVQAIDIVESGIARVLGLAELRLRMAGSGRADSRLAYLPAAQTRVLRARLLAVAHGVDEGVAEPPEWLLFTMPTGLLIVSIVLSGPGLSALALVAAVIVLALIAPSAAVGFLSGAAAAILGLATALWRRFNGRYHLQIAEAGDGFRLRSGLVQTAAETIPVARVQTVRLVEPLLWRPFGWCRLEVAVAGHRGGDERETQERNSRAVLMIGDLQQAAALLHRLVPGAPAQRRPPPPRARWKSPLSFHNLAWYGDDNCVVTVSGRVTRRTEWIRLAKVQSIRMVQGPVQRRLNLASIHLDAAGRRVRVELTDRDFDEANAVLQALPQLCAQARVRS